MATHSSILAWQIPWQRSLVGKRVGQDLVTKATTITYSKIGVHVEAFQIHKVASTPTCVTLTKYLTSHSQCSVCKVLTNNCTCLTGYYDNYMSKCT